MRPRRRHEYHQHSWSNRFPLGDFRAVRRILEDSDYALVRKNRKGRAARDRVDEDTWHGMWVLPDSVAVQTSDVFRTIMREAGGAHTLGSFEVVSPRNSLHPSRFSGPVGHTDLVRVWMRFSRSVCEGWATRTTHASATSLDGRSGLRRPHWLRPTAQPSFPPVTFFVVPVSRPPSARSTLRSAARVSAIEPRTSLVGVRAFGLGRPQPAARATRCSSHSGSSEPYSGYASSIRAWTQSRRMS